MNENDTKPKAFPSTISWSSISMLVECPQKWALNYIFRRGEVEFSPHLAAGRAFAAALEAARACYWRGAKSASEAALAPKSGNPEAALIAGARAMMAAYDDRITDAVPNKSLPRLLDGMLAYFEEWPLEKDIPHELGKGEEFTVSYPTGIPNPDDPNEEIVFVGVIDFLKDDGEGNIIIVDDKTASSLGQRWHDQWPMRGQFLGYAYALMQYGYTVRYVEVRGVAFLKDRISTAAATIFVPEWRAHEWWQNALEALRSAIQYYKDWRWPMAYGHACVNYGKCGFMDYCLAHPAQRAAILDTYPIRQEEDGK